MLYLTLIVVQIVLFAALFFFMKTLLTRNLTNATEHLNDLNKDYDTKLEEVSKRRLEADEYYEKTVDAAKNETEKERTRLLSEAHDTQDQILKQARKKSEEIIEQANRASAKILLEIDEKVAELAVRQVADGVRKVLSGEIGRDVHEKRVEELLNQSWDELDRMKLPDQLFQLTVVSAFPLSEAQSKRLLQKANQKLNRDVKINYEVSEDLIAGFKMTVGSIVLDGTISFKIREVVRFANVRQK